MQATPMIAMIIIGLADSVIFASKYDAIPRVEPFLVMILVGARKSEDTNKNFTYDNKRNVAKASITDALMSHCLRKRA